MIILEPDDAILPDVTLLDGVVSRDVIECSSYSLGLYLSKGMKSF